VLFNMFIYMLSFLFFYFALMNAQDAPTGPTPTAIPSPPASYCDQFGIGGATNLVDTYLWNKPANDTTSFVSYSLCSTISSTCGETGAGCATVSSNCCGMCQGWSEADGPVTTCLGKFSKAFTEGGYLNLQYDGGDVVVGQNVGRRGIIKIQCGAGGSPGNPNVLPNSFKQASGHEPNEPFIYTLYVTSPLVCGGIGGGAILLLIMFLVLLPLYVVGGFLANKFYFMKEEEDKSIVEYLPNYEFWTDTPSLFMEGLRFTKSKFMALIGKEEEY